MNKQIDYVKCNLCGFDNSEILPVKSIRASTDQGERVVVCKECDEKSSSDCEVLEVIEKT